MKFLYKLLKIKNFYRKCEEGFLVFLLIFSTVSVCYSVLMRYVFNSPVAWNEEIVCYVQVWLAFIGVSYIARNEGQFIRFDFFLHRSSAGTKTAFFFIEHSIMLVFTGAFTIISALWIEKLYHIGGLSTPMMIPNYIPRAVICLSFFLLFIHYFEGLLSKVITLIRHRKDRKDHKEHMAWM